MWLRRLTVEGVRNLRDVELDLSEGLHFFTGANGAGKTSILEAVYCLSSGRSFRSGSRTDFLDRKRGEATIYGEIVAGTKTTRLGILRRSGEWQARRDGTDVASLGELARSLSVLAFHPRLHQLVEGPPEERRRFLDFGVFHVEHSFLEHWSAYRRGLKQRNAALKQGAAHSMVTAWDSVLAEHGTEVHQARSAVLVRLKERFQARLAQLAPTIQELDLVLAAGWSGESLGEALRGNLHRDALQGSTGQGPHRSDVQIRDAHGLVAGRLSRGQQKLVVLAMTLAMRELLAEIGDATPVFCFDDFGSELDVDHQELVLGDLEQVPGQVLLTGTHLSGPARALATRRVFHVEHGRVAEVL